MKPHDYIAKHGLGYFIGNKGKIITFRLLSDDTLIFSGYFVGITKEGDNLPLIKGLLIEQKQYNLHFFYKDPDDGRLIPVIVNVLLIDSMDDILFSDK